MKFLIDVNLPPRLSIWLRKRGHEAQHLEDLGLLTATDTVVWEFGREQNSILVSKDVDLFHRALLIGPPPQVLHIDIGNSSNNRLFQILDASWKEIEPLLLQGHRMAAIRLSGPDPGQAVVDIY